MAFPGHRLIVAAALAAVALAPALGRAQVTSHVAVADATLSSDTPAGDDEIVEVLPANAPAGSVFESGQYLVERNAGEALGTSRKELEEGLRRVERALAEGFKGKAKAYKALGMGYSALGTRVGASSEEALAFLAKAGDAWRMLAEMEPSRPEWGMLYARTRQSDEDRTVALGDVVRRTPGHIAAWLWLAKIECHAGRMESGMRYIESAVRALSPEDIEAKTQSLASAGYACGGDPAADRVLELLGDRTRSGSTARKPKWVRAEVIRKPIEDPPSNASPSAMFESGKGLIDRNALDAVSSEPAELEEGIRRVKRALEKGFPDRIRALKVLDAAYSAFRQQAARSTDEAREYRIKVQGVYRELAVLEPSRVEWGMRLVETLASEADQIAELRRIVARFPEHWPAVDALAERACRGVRSAEVAQRVLAVASHMSPGEMAKYGGEVISAAWRCGGESDAARVRAILESRTRK